MKSNERLIVLAHGSNDPNWKRPFQALTRDLQQRLGRSGVRLAFMQLAAPSLLEVVAEAVEDGIHRLKVLPLFLSVGAHIAQDIPEQIEAARASHPGVEIDLLPAVGTDPRVMELLQALAMEAASTHPVANVT